MISKVSIGVARFIPVARQRADSWTACVPVDTVDREWLKRGLYYRKLVCPPSLNHHVAYQPRRNLLSQTLEPGTVVIGVDPHKASWTAAAVDASLQSVATIRVRTDRTGYRRLRAFAAQWPVPSGRSRAPADWAPL